MLLLVLLLLALALPTLLQLQQLLLQLLLLLTLLVLLAGGPVRADGRVAARHHARRQQLQDGLYCRPRRGRGYRPGHRLADLLRQDRRYVLKDPCCAFLTQCLLLTRSAWQR